MENENNEPNNDADNDFHHISMWAQAKSASERKSTLMHNKTSKSIVE